MDIKQLAVFAAVVEESSFSKAAEALYLTQPTVTGHIKRLESELGVPLLLRSTRKLALTEQGRILYSYAVRMIRLEQRALDALHGNPAAETVHIGASSIPSAYILPHAITGFSMRHPEVVFQITRKDSMNVIDDVANGLLDLGMVGTIFDNPLCRFHPFAQDTLVLATPNTDAYRRLIGNESAVPLLLAEPMIFREEGSGTRQEAEKLLHKLQVDPGGINIVATFDDPEGIRNSVVQGMGVSIVSQRSIEKQVQDGSLLTFSLEQGESVRNLYLVTQTDTPLLGSTREFFRYVLRSAW